jgi:hypothetical protein
MSGGRALRARSPRKTQPPITSSPSRPTSAPAPPPPHPRA